MQVREKVSGDRQPEKEWARGAAEGRDGLGPGGRSKDQACLTARTVSDFLKIKSVSNGRS